MIRIVNAGLAVAVAVIGCPALSANATTGNDLCNAMHWPMPLPPTVGYGISHVANDSILVCLIDHMVATAPDGHDVLNDTQNNASDSWRIASMTPPAGTLVPMNQLIKLTVVRDYSAPS